jgi:hypothetical protein
VKHADPVARMRLVSHTVGHLQAGDSLPSHGIAKATDNYGIWCDSAFGVTDAFQHLMYKSRTAKTLAKELRFAHIFWCRKYFTQSSTHIHS